jgi:hypothetical protein
LELLVREELLVVRGGVVPLITTDIDHRSLVCQTRIVQILHLMGSHDLRLVVWLDNPDRLKHELVRDRALVRELLLVNHDHISLLGVLNAF